MFPTPIEKTSSVTRSAYRIALPLSLVIWLVPLLGVMLTAMRGPGDITAGNLWGLPTQWMFFANMRDVFGNTPMLDFLINSF